MLRTNGDILSFIGGCVENETYNRQISLREFTKGSILLEQGNIATKIFIIKEGITKCYFREENGKNYILEFLGSGQIVGELEVIRGIACLCNIEAVTQLQAYVLTVPMFNLLLEHSPAFSRILLSEMAERIINTSSRSSFQQLYSIEHALKRLLQLKAQHQLDITKQDMACYLGITLRSLNRLLTNEKP